MPIVLPETDSCFLCGIADAGGEHWSVWAEDELTLTSLNGRQFETGQSLVFPRRHAPTIMDLEEDELTAVMHAARRAADVLVATFDPDGILLYQNNGVGSAQEVPHFHLHVVPRQPGSDWGVGPPHIARLAGHSVEAKFDYTQVTAEKQFTADRLRQATVDEL